MRANESYTPRCIVTLTGRHNAGQEDLADALMRNYGYLHLQLSDPLYGMLEKLEPLIAGRPLGYHLRQSSFDWGVVIEQYPVVHRMLLSLGLSVRGLDDWILASRVLHQIAMTETHIVISDARLTSELDVFAKEGLVVEVARSAEVPASPDQDTFEQHSDSWCAAVRASGKSNYRKEVLCGANDPAPEVALDLISTDVHDHALRVAAAMSLDGTSFASDFHHARFHAPSHNPRGE